MVRVRIYWSCWCGTMDLSEAFCMERGRCIKTRAVWRYVDETKESERAGCAKVLFFYVAHIFPFASHACLEPPTQTFSPSSTRRLGLARFISISDFDWLNHHNAQWHKPLSPVSNESFSTWTLLKYNDNMATRQSNRMHDQLIEYHPWHWHDRVTRIDSVIRSKWRVYNNSTSWNGQSLSDDYDSATSFFFRHALSMTTM